MTDEYCCDCGSAIGTHAGGRFEGTDDEGTPIFDGLCIACDTRHKAAILEPTTQPGSEATGEGKADG